VIGDVESELGDWLLVVGEVESLLEVGGYWLLACRCLNSVDKIVESLIVEGFLLRLREPQASGGAIR
jgi:hypothetical protein